MAADSTEINLLLDQYKDGRDGAFDKLISLVYGELKKIAAYQLSAERPGHTLQPTALVHEAYLKLAAQNPINWHDKSHFFALASQVMRHILVDHARSRLRHKRAGVLATVAVEEILNLNSKNAPELIALDDALNTLAEIDRRKSRIVELRYFGGLSLEETADILGISVATVRREWTTAKAWLRREMGHLSRKN